MQVRSIDLNQLRGVTDKGLGLGKEFVGVLVGSERLQREGQAQQERAAAELRALGEQVRSEKLDAKAKTYEARERIAQQAKPGSTSDDLRSKSGSGIGETIKGKAKEVVGNITDNNPLRHEGAAQKKKGQAESEATLARVKAKGYEAEAKEAELEQRVAESG